MITSVSNPQIKQVIHLCKKAKERDEKGCFVAEGQRLVREIPKERLISAYASESYINAGRWLPDAPVECVSDKVFKEMSDTKTPQGILAVVRQYSYSIQDMIKGPSPLILVLEAIQDPGNLGTMIRMAEGAGASGILLSRTSVDIYNPKVVRSTMGSIFRVPFVYAGNIFEAVKILADNHINLYAAHLKGENYHFEADYTGKTAFLIGNEANGLSDELASMAGRYIRIPMDGQVESLNAAMAATILMYEAKRQRIVNSCFDNK